MDDIIQDLNPFGKYQKLIVTFIGIPSALAGITTYSIIFIAAKPDFICKSFIKSNNSNNSSNIINNCQLWSNWTNNNYNNSNIEQCNFDDKYYGRTIITDWNLICDKKFLAGLTQTFYMLGALLSAFSGYFGDRFGRMKSTLAFLWILSITMLLSQLLMIDQVDFSNNAKYIIYCISQLLVGGLVKSVDMSAYVLLLETTTREYHTLLSSLKLVFYILGELVIMSVAYLSRNWLTINWMVTAIAIAASIMSLFLIDESARWLVSQKKYDEAFRILKKMARYNKRELKIKKLDFKIAIDNETHKVLNTKVKDNQNHDYNEDNLIKVNKSIIKMFKQTFYPKKIFIKTFLIAYVWVAITLLYYGQSFSITSIDAINPYILFIFQSIAELIGYWFAMLNNKFGHRKSLIAYLSITTAMCLIVSFLPRNKDLSNSQKVLLDAIMVIALISIAKCSISAAYNTCYVYTSQLYTTNVRNFALLFCSCFGRIGSIISPQIILLADIVWKPLPFLIFSICSFIASFAILILPETNK